MNIYLLHIYLFILLNDLLHNIYQVNLTGGYYDAGDNVKFGWPMAFSASLLSWAAVEHRAQLSSVGQHTDLLNAIRWGTDFILKSHTSPTTFYTQVPTHQSIPWIFSSFSLKKWKNKLIFSEVQHYIFCYLFLTYYIL